MHAIMRAQHLVIDGYCLIHRDPDTARLAGSQMTLARRVLVRKAESLAGVFADQVTVVFDGQSAGLADEFENLAVRVRFTAAHESADCFIQRLAFDRRSAEGLVVVTSDRSIIESVLACGGEIVSCAEFIDRCRQQTRTARRTLKQTQVRRRHTLGDYFPK